LGKEKGWISLSRSIVDNWVWDNGEQFSRGQAWIDLLLSANHEDRKIMFDGKPLLVKRGSFVTSQHKLADKWHWGRHKVSLFLKALQSDQMIDTIVNHQQTAIIVRNYAKFQAPTNGKGTSEEPAMNHCRTTDGQVRDINNNGNKLNKKNNMAASTATQVNVVRTDRQGYTNF